MQLPEKLKHYNDALKQLPVVKVAAIYLLVSQGKVMYVGQSRNLSRRITGHEQSDACDEVWYVPTPSHSLDARERQFIRALNPPWNRSRGPSIPKMIWAGGYRFVKRRTWGPWYVIFTLNGRRIWRSLHTADKQSAIVKARQIVLLEKSNSRAATLSKYKLKV